ncbi:MAG: hypothetical protein JJU28_18850 [Cyclobacteriaceae bacterium]|nr:hypothetical protein [Cyclobacteriaceae bacterium]
MINRLINLLFISPPLITGDSKYLLLFVFAFFKFTASAQPDYTRSDIYQKFNNISTVPDLIPFEHKIPFNQHGGHLQGIQMLREKDQSFIYLSASSSNIAYLLKLRIYPNAKTIEVDTLMQEPFRHAGGFQIYQHYLAIGIEDNYTRDIAVVNIYNLSESAFAGNPTYTFQRKGAYEKVTAGATGICKYKNEIILAVANWDARNIDFYSIPEAAFIQGKGSFSKIFTYEAQDADRSNWINPEWLSYQNINLFTDDQGRLFMLGFTRDNTDRQVADLFVIHVEPAEDIRFHLQKIHSKNFTCHSGADFKAGVGAHILENGQMIIFACPYHIAENGVLNVFAP